MAFATSFVGGASAAEEKIFRIGVIYDLSGANAASGGLAASIGAALAIKMINERGGVEGYRIVPIVADGGSSVDTAFAAAKQLIADEHVDMIMGLNTSRECAPIAGMVETAKSFMWITGCISFSVLKDRDLHYVFRPQVDSDQVGEASCRFLTESLEHTIHRAASELRVAIVYEDSAYGIDVAAANKRACRERGVQVALKEGFRTNSTDVRDLMARLKRVHPHIVLHTAYYPDVVTFLKQAAELGLTFEALIGQGAGYAQVDALVEEFDDDVEYLFNVDPAPAQLIDPTTLEPGLGALTDALVAHYREMAGGSEVPSHASQGFNNAWIFLTDVLPRAIKEYGGISPDALRRAALATDIAEGGTIMGYGVEFFGPGEASSGQNMRAFPVVMQYRGGATEIVWPKALRTIEPVLRLPGDHAFSPG